MSTDHDHVSLRGPGSRNVYRQQPIDPSVPPLSASQLLSIPSFRPRRKVRETPLDPYPSRFYGDAIIQKEPDSIRFFFQNVKGLSSTTRKEDYHYYLTCLQALGVDVTGLSETNTCWTHSHLAYDFRLAARRFFPQTKVVYGSPTPEIDPVPTKETFQAGGNLTMITSGLVSRATGSEIQDPSGLGRWNGLTLTGSDGKAMSVITAYRVCSASPLTASIGSAFLREYDYLRDRNHVSPNPRRVFFSDLKDVVIKLLESGNEIIVMMDANATLADDQHFSDFVNGCSLFDLHDFDPAPSTFVGAPSRRIDYILGTQGVREKMVRSGTLSYYEGPQSDHRGLYIDLKSDFLTYPSSEIAAMSTRSLHTGNPELVNKYHQVMLKYYTEHKMMERIDDLAANFRTMPRDEVRKQLHKWDNDQGRAMAAAEKSLSRPPQKYQWSPVLRNAAITRLYWKLRLREAQHQHDYSATFLRWQRQLNLHDTSFSFPLHGVPLSTDQIRVEFNKATRVLRSCQRKSIPLRMRTYEDLIDQYEADIDPATSGESKRKLKIVQRTMETEVIRAQFNTLRRVLKPSHSQGLSKILVPRRHDDMEVSEDTYRLLQESDPEDLIWETIIDRAHIERQLLIYNRDSFRAAAASPLGHGAIHDAISFSSLSDASAALLRGHTPPEWSADDRALQEFLASFTIPPRVLEKPEIDTIISEEDVSKGFGTWKESTSTSPSGRHLGHYKAIIKQPVLLKCLTQFMNIAIQSGIAVPRWSNAVNVLIEKDPGKPRINHLRIIHLFEADFNFFSQTTMGSSAG
jgi:hypothetical protein